jgi:hypothetical protein
MKRLFTALMVAVFCWLAEPSVHAGNITIAPAGISMKGSAGHAATQVFSVVNSSDTPLVVTVDVADVLVRDGKRVFVPAGRTVGSIAAMVTTATKEFTLGPGEERRVPVTFVLPAETSIRAVAVFFHALPPQTTSKIRIRLNLGAVVDFSTSNEIVLQIAKPAVIPPTAGSNAVITEQLENVGPEPAIVRGVAAILDGPGKLVGKATFDQRRLLPGEKNSLRAEYAGTLSPGKYRLLSSLEYAGQTITRSTEFIVP